MKKPVFWCINLVLFILLFSWQVTAQSGEIGGYNVYYGHLHNHCAISDGTGTADDAYNYAKNTAGLDFFGLSDHAYLMSDSEWQTVISTANNYNEDGVFAAFWGFEWSHSTYGHVTVVNTNDYCSTSSQPAFSDLLSWVNTRECVAFFNHPGRQNSTGVEFGHFQNTPSDKFVGMELWNKNDLFNVYYYNDGYYSSDGNLGYFDEALTRGWKIGAEGSEDNHVASWGTYNNCNLAVLATNLTKTDIYEAIKSRRFFSTLDKNIKMSFKIDGNEMGSTMEGNSGQSMQILLSDDDGENFSKIQLFLNGVVVTTWNPGVSNVTINETVSTSDGDYYYIKVTQDDGDEAISSPIFIEGGIVNEAPVCSITHPANGAHFDLPQTLLLSANASDADGTISVVEFFIDGISVGTDNAAPYQLNWVVPTSGSYRLSAKATDNLGAATTSDPVYFSAGVFSESISTRIASGSDDVEEGETGYIYMSSTDLELVYDAYAAGGSPQGNQTVGLRFTNLNIPQGAVINSASIQFTCDETSSDLATLDIFGHAFDDSPAFTSASGDVSGRTKTSAFVTWNPAAWNTTDETGTNQLTPDLSAVIQEIVNRTGFSLSSSISIIMTGTGTRIAEAYEGSSTSAAVLNIDYTVGSQNTAPEFTSNGVIKGDATEDSHYSSTIAGSATDADGDTLSYSKTSGPNWLTVSTDGSISGTPLQNDVGINNWIVSVSDGNGGSDQTTLQITVQNVNDNPLFINDTLMLPDATEEINYSASLSNQASDEDGDSLTFSKISGPDWLTIGTDGTLTGTPAIANFGTNLWEVQVSDGNNGQDVAILKVQVNEKQDIEYCSSSGNSDAAFIKSIQINNEVYNSGDDGGYGDYTGFQTINLENNSTISLVLSPDFNGRSTHQYWAVWIDYDQNGFDSGDLVFAPLKSKSTISGSFTTTAATGLMRMRISMSDSGTPPVCGDIGGGEVEDYTVYIGPAVPNQLDADFEATTSTSIPVGATVSFSDLTNYTPDTYSWGFDGGNADLTDPANPVVTYNTAGTYDVSLTVTKDGKSDTETKYGYITVTEGPIPGEYCIPQNLSSFKGDFIQEITIGSFQNTYTSFTAYSAPSPLVLFAGSNNITLIPDNASNRNFWGIWVNLSEDDSDFDDGGETLLATGAVKGTYTGSIEIPETANDKRMRISMKTNAAPSPCDDSFNGEVKDFTLSVVSTKSGSVPAVTSDSEEFAFHIYPNPASDKVFIQTSGWDGDKQIKILNIFGQSVYLATHSEKLFQIDISTLPKGIYMVQIRNAFNTKLAKLLVE